MDRLTRSVVTRLSTLREIANAVKKVVRHDKDGSVTFEELSKEIEPLVGRERSPALYRDIQQAARMMGLVVSFQHRSRRCVRGVVLRG